MALFSLFMHSSAGGLVVNGVHGALFQPQRHGLQFQLQQFAECLSPLFTLSLVLKPMGQKISWKKIFARFIYWTALCMPPLSSQMELFDHGFTTQSQQQVVGS